MKRACFILSLFFVFSVGAQSPPMERIGVEQGLSQGYVTYMMQDKERFIWAGTANGLNRYDGQRFKVFSHNSLDSNSLSGNYISALFDIGEYLLIGTFKNGLNIMHKRTQKIIRIPHHAPLHSPSGSKKGVSNVFPAENVMGHMVKDDLGNIWMIASNRMFTKEGFIVKMEVPMGFWEKLYLEPALIKDLKFHSWLKSEFRANCNSNLFSYSQGELFCFQNNGAEKYDIKTDQWTYAEVNKSLLGPVQNIV